MRVNVKFNGGPGIEVDLVEEASVADLKEHVGRQHGVSPDQLKVLFAGRELQNNITLQGCDLPEQSTVHVVLPPPGCVFQLRLQERLRVGREDSLTRLDLSNSRLSSSSSGLAVILEKSTTEGETSEEESTCRRSDSSFYVYCKSVCRAIRPGKLRVRCRRCRQTTFILSRGPSCWDDILLQGRIHGVCQSEGCHGNIAEFYLKCAVHPTSDDDLSVALDLIMTNVRSVPCIACTDVMSPVLVFQCAERHVICLECFHRYCETRLNERQFIHHPVIGYSLPCAVGCPDSLIKEVHHFRILSDRQYERYHSYGAEECVFAMGGVFCPAPGCGAGLLPEEDSRRIQCERSNGLGCGFVFCRNCREEYHEGACQVQLAPPTCGTSQGYVVDEEAALRARWERDSQQTIQETTRPCPQCRVPVEKNGGCMHMQCPRSQCRFEWCWLCGVQWNRECMGNHWFG
ncbi:E3 ubiquitin-protein ligase parkin isoform X2 [Lampris incognitus]|uniref:E3 ubiquitin-protein ligase parkin isoform X2 n=1 Tax=Lampris incognitus TaxID=2546036 RepID=UPI0024B5A12E|nr:E3 ubiquitin-protein ligase parkin isoform X2 [Lampris incognitus]